MASGVCPARREVRCGSTSWGTLGGEGSYPLGTRLFRLQICAVTTHFTLWGFGGDIRLWQRGRTF